MEMESIKMAMVFGMKQNYFEMTMKTDSTRKKNCFVMIMKMVNGTLLNLMKTQMLTVFGVSLKNSLI